MKKIFICIPLLLSFSVSFAQIIDNPLSPYYIYFGRQPSAKAEAMGRGLVTNPSNEFSSFYNPASSSLSEGLTVSFSTSSKYYLDTSANYNYKGLNYNIKDIGTFGVSRYHIGTGYDMEIGDGFNYNLYTINYSRKITGDFYGGININFLNAHIPFLPVVGAGSSQDNDPVGVFADIGFLKIFKMKKPMPGNTSHEIILAASIVNITSSTIDIGYKKDIPVIIKVGAGQNFNFLQNTLIKNSNLLKIFSQIEFEHELRGGNISIFKAGADATLYGIFSLRAGLHHLVKNSSNPSQTHLTYGFGLNIPVNDLTNGKYPFKINIDYVDLKEAATSQDFIYYNYGNFNVVSMKLSWLPE